MSFTRPIALLAATLALLAPSLAAELPADKTAKPLPPATAKRCNIGGVSGVLAANGVCVRMSGYVEGGVQAHQLK